MDTRTRWIIPALMATTAATAAAAVTVASASPRASGCVAPRLIGLTEPAAARQARAAGCVVHLAGATLKQARIQTVERQSPAPGTRSVDAVVSLTLNPLCFGEALNGPPPDQGMRPGPTELITGLYIVGGPALPYSTPRCRHRPGQPTTGTIEVSTGGAPIASQTITRRRLVTFTLPPGRYRVSGRIQAGAAPSAQPFTIRAGFTTRRYVIVPVP